MKNELIFLKNTILNELLSISLKSGVKSGTAKKKQKKNEFFRSDYENIIKTYSVRNFYALCLYIFFTVK